MSLRSLRLIAVRAAAFALDIGLWVVLCALVLLIDLKTGWLLAYDGVKVGLWFLVVLVIGQEFFFESTIGKRVFGLRFHLAGGAPAEAYRFRILLRGLLFWLLVVGASSVPNPLAIGNIWRTRSIVFFSIALGMAIGLWVPITIVLGKGQQGIHDWLTRTRIDTHGVAPGAGGLRLRPLVSSLFLLTGFLCFISAYVEWQGNLGRAVVEILNSAEASALLPANQVQVPPKRTAERLQNSISLDQYIDRYGTWLPGSTLMKEVVVPHEAITDLSLLDELANSYLNEMERTVDGKYEWILIELSNYRYFGPVGVRTYFHMARWLTMNFQAHPIHLKSHSAEDGLHRSVELELTSGWNPGDFHFARSRSTLREKAYWDLRRDLQREMEGIFRLDAVEFQRTSLWAVHMYPREAWSWWIVGRMQESITPGSGKRAFRMALELEPLYYRAAEELALSLLRGPAEHWGEVLELVREFDGGPIMTLTLKSAEAYSYLLLGDTLMAACVLDSIMVQFPGAASDDELVQHLKGIIRLKN